MADCIFCMLANHDIPTNVVYEDDEMFCFHDAEPQAPVHVLLIPKKHIECIDDIKEELRDGLWEKATNEYNCCTEDELAMLLDEELWTYDSVTGNASGSYFCNAWKAEEAI